jgi:hypothetical protein
VYQQQKNSKGKGAANDLLQGFEGILISDR